MRPSGSLHLCVLAALAVSLSGCTGSSRSMTALGTSGQIAGKLQGGQQPVTGATIQVYSAGTTGSASASTPLLATPATTAPDGSFTLAGSFTCPAPDAQVYLVATGGDPGFSNGTAATRSLP